MTVCDLLKASMQAHNLAKPRGRTSRPPGWLDSLREAARLRQEALRADPEQNEDCWLDYGNHEALMAFYADKDVL